MTGRWALLVAGLLVATMALGVSGVALAEHGGHRCTVATLDGLYVFAATGFTIPASGPAQPKAIVEFIRFNGDGRWRSGGDAKPERCDRTDTARRDRELHRGESRPSGRSLYGQPHFHRRPNLRPILPGQGRGHLDDPNQPDQRVSGDGHEGIALTQRRSSTRATRRMILSQAKESN